MYIVISRAVFLLLSNVVSASPKNQTAGLWEHKMGYVMFRSLNLWSRMKALLFRGWWIITREGGVGVHLRWPLWESLEDFQTNSPIHPSFLGMTPPINFTHNFESDPSPKYSSYKLCQISPHTSSTVVSMSLVFTILLLLDSLVLLVFQIWSLISWLICILSTSRVRCRV